MSSGVTYRIEAREVKARMDTSTVKTVIDMGYSREMVRRAIETRLRTTGDDFPDAKSLLEAIFALEEQLNTNNEPNTSSTSENGACGPVQNGAIQPAHES